VEARNANKVRPTDSSIFNTQTCLLGCICTTCMRQLAAKDGRTASFVKVFALASSNAILLQHKLYIIVCFDDSDSYIISLP
jgi:hypothetical protein